MAERRRSLGEDAGIAERKRRTWAKEAGIAERRTSVNDDVIGVYSGERPRASHESSAYSSDYFQNHRALKDGGRRTSREETRCPSPATASELAAKISAELKGINGKEELKAQLESTSCKSCSSQLESNSCPELPLPARSSMDLFSDDDSSRFFVENDDIEINWQEDLDLLGELESFVVAPLAAAAMSASNPLHYHGNRRVSKQLYEDTLLSLDKREVVPQSLQRTSLNDALLGGLRLGGVDVPGMVVSSLSVGGPEGGRSRRVSQGAEIIQPASSSRLWPSSLASPQLPTETPMVQVATRRMTLPSDLHAPQRYVQGRSVSGIQSTRPRRASGGSIPSTSTAMFSRRGSSFDHLSASSFG